MAGLVPGWFDTFQGGAGSSFGHQVQSGQNIASGDLIVVGFSWFDTLGTGLTASVSDGTSNSYTQYGSYNRSGSVSGGQINGGVFICNSATNAATQPTITVTLSGSQIGGIGIGYLKYTNQNASPRDQISTPVTNGAVALSVTCNSLTTSAANELAIVFGSEDATGNPRPTPTYTGSTPDANYVTRCDCSNNSSSQDLLIADRGSSTDANGQIGSSVSTAPRYNMSTSQFFIIDHFLLLPATGGGAQDTPEIYGRPDGRRGQVQMIQLLAQ